MFRTRPRGSLRAAALLAVGVSPLLAGVSAAAPAPSLDGLEGKVGDAPELITKVADEAGKIASGQTVKLPTPDALPQAPTAPVAGLPEAPQIADVAHALPGAPSLLPPAQGRAFPTAPSLDQVQVDQLSLNQLPLNQLPSTDELPIQLSSLGGGLPLGGLPLGG